MGTERGLFKKPRNESVIFDIIDVLLLECALPTSQPESQLAVNVPKILVALVLGHRLPPAPQNKHKNYGPGSFWCDTNPSVRRMSISRYLLSAGVRNQVSARECDGRHVRNVDRRLTRSDRNRSEGDATMPRYK